jgi:hypothetical protein
MQAGQSTGIEAVGAVGQQGGFTEVATRADMTDNVMAAALDAQRQFHLAAGNNIKMTVIFTLLIDVLTLFDGSPLATGDNLLSRTGVDVLEKYSPVQALHKGLIVGHKSKSARLKIIQFSQGR